MPIQLFPSPTGGPCHWPIVSPYSNNNLCEQQPVYRNCPGWRAPAQRQSVSTSSSGLLPEPRRRGKYRVYRAEIWVGRLYPRGPAAWLQARGVVPCSRTSPASTASRRRWSSLSRASWRRSRAEIAKPQTPASIPDPAPPGWRCTLPLWRTRPTRPRIAASSEGCRCTRWFDSVPWDKGVRGSTSSGATP